MQLSTTTIHRETVRQSCLDGRRTFQFSISLIALWFLSFYFVRLFSQNVQLWKYRDYPKVQSRLHCSLRLRIESLKQKSRKRTRNPSRSHVGRFKAQRAALRGNQCEFLCCNPPRRLSKRHDVIEAGFLSFLLNKTIKVTAARSYRDRGTPEIFIKSFIMETFHNNLWMNIMTIHVTSAIIDQK